MTNSITINTPDLFTLGTTLGYPSTLSGTTGRRYMTGNMLLVPEPSAFWLAGSGILRVIAFKILFFNLKHIQPNILNNLNSRKIIYA